MRCFINVFKADLKRFWNIAWKLYIAFAVYSLMQALIFFANMNKSINKGRIAAVSLGDSLMDFFKGAKEFYPERNLAMDIPVLSSRPFSPPFFAVSEQVPKCLLSQFHLNIKTSFSQATILSYTT